MTSERVNNEHGNNFRIPGIRPLEVQYIRYACRSLETLETISEKGIRKIWWIYNYEGKHFRVFESQGAAQDFLDNKGDDWVIDFDSEEELDRFLELELKN